jgi:hypothetical protein
MWPFVSLLQLQLELQLVQSAMRGLWCRHAVDYGLCVVLPLVVAEELVGVEGVALQRRLRHTKAQLTIDTTQP